MLSYKRCLQNYSVYEFETEHLAAISVTRISRKNITSIAIKIRHLYLELLFLNYQYDIVRGIFHSFSYFKTCLHVTRNLCLLLVIYGVKLRKSLLRNVVVFRRFLDSIKKYKYFV